MTFCITLYILFNDDLHYIVIWVILVVLFYWFVFLFHLQCTNSSRTKKCITGFPRSWKVLDFFGYNFQVLESPGKWGVFSWKVLAIWLQGPGKSWNFLGYDNDVGGGQNDTRADVEICRCRNLRVRTSLPIVPLSEYSLPHISTA